jgi:hypothetical protein
MATLVKVYRLRRANGNDPIEVSLWAHTRDERKLGGCPRFSISIDDVAWSSDGLTPRSAMWVEGRLGKLRALAARREKRAAERRAAKGSS